MAFKLLDDIALNPFKIFNSLVQRNVSACSRAALLRSVVTYR